MARSFIHSFSLAVLHRSKVAPVAIEIHSSHAFEIWILNSEIDSPFVSFHKHSKRESKQAGHYLPKIWIIYQQISMESSTQALPMPSYTWNDPSRNRHSEGAVSASYDNNSNNKRSNDTYLNHSYAEPFEPSSATNNQSRHGASSSTFQSSQRNMSLNTMQESQQQPYYYGDSSDWGQPDQQAYHSLHHQQHNFTRSQQLQQPTHSTAASVADTSFASHDSKASYQFHNNNYNHNRWKGSRNGGWEDRGGNGGGIWSADDHSLTTHSTSTTNTTTGGGHNNTTLLARNPRSDASSFMGSSSTTASSLQYSYHDQQQHQHHHQEQPFLDDAGGDRSFWSAADDTVASNATRSSALPHFGSNDHQLQGGLFGLSSLGGNGEHKPGDRSHEGRDQVTPEPSPNSSRYSIILPQGQQEREDEVSHDTSSPTSYYLPSASFSEHPADIVPASSASTYTNESGAHVSSPTADNVLNPLADLVPPTPPYSLPVLQQTSSTASASLRMDARHDQPRNNYPRQPHNHGNYRSQHYANNNYDSSYQGRTDESSSYHNNNGQRSYPRRNQVHEDDSYGGDNGGGGRRRNNHRGKRGGGGHRKQPRNQHFPKERTTPPGKRSKDLEELSQLPAPSIPLAADQRNSARGGSAGGSPDSTDTAKQLQKASSEAIRQLIKPRQQQQRQQQYHSRESDSVSIRSKSSYSPSNSSLASENRPILPQHRPELDDQADYSFHDYEFEEEKILDGNGNPLFDDNDSWNSGSNNPYSSKQGVGNDSPSRKQEWLLRMNRRLQDTPVGELDPSVVPISAVMNAWAKSKSAQGASMVELWLLRAQEESDAGNKRVVPTSKMYTMAGKCQSYAMVIHN